MKIHGCEADAIKALQQFEQELDALKAKYGVAQDSEEAFMNWYSSVKYYDESGCVSEKTNYANMTAKEYSRIGI
jgi:hypothetical protein